VPKLGRHLRAAIRTVLEAQEVEALSLTGTYLVVVNMSVAKTTKII
jgi:hypothetical protein